MTRNGRLLATGGNTGVLKLYHNLQEGGSSKSLGLRSHTALHGHSDAITCITVSQEWSIIVSGSQDQSCIIWDLNRSCFITSLNDHQGRIICTEISPTTVRTPSFSLGLF